MRKPPAPGLPRIALVFGEDAAAAHVREALQEHLDIVYASSAADFDAAHMADANVVAVLVNVDGGDWLEDIEASLDATGIPLVYNDPEISRGLEGWPRARWLRHLLAKLRGSTDVDPPRPEPTAAASGECSADDAGADPRTPGAEVVERPLSPQEIETMTADFMAVQPTVAAQATETPPAAAAIDGRSGADTPLSATTQESSPGRPPIGDVDEATVDALGAPTPDPEAESQPDGECDLDVDTETLSAMIDARLANAESQPAPGSQEVWRVVEGGAASPEPALAVEAVADPAAAVGEPASLVEATADAHDDAEVLASLPSLDDWQLVDADAFPAAAPAAARETSNAVPELPDSLAGLELVPMEAIAAVQIHTDPIERWLHESEPRKSGASAGGAVKTGSGGKA